MAITSREVLQNVFDSLFVFVFFISNYVKLSSFIALSSHSELTIDVGYSDVGSPRFMFPII